MLYLIKKELTANIKYVLMGFVILIVYAVVFSGRGSAFTLCSTICFYTIMTTNLVLDERYKIDLLITTLPIRRRIVVLSKYMMIPLLLAACFVLYTLLSFGGRAIGYDKLSALTFPDVMLGFFIVSVYNAIMLPLSYRFGAQSTRYVALVLFFLVFFGSTAIGTENIKEFFTVLQGLKDGQFGLLLLGAGLIVSVISYMIAYPIYAKKDF